MSYTVNIAAKKATVPVMKESGSRKYAIVPSAFISSLRPLSTSGSVRSVLLLVPSVCFSNLSMPRTLMPASTNYIPIST